MSKTVIRKQDKYNSDKTWLIKEYSSSEVYINQEIKGKQFYSKWQKSNKNFVKGL